MANKRGGEKKLYRCFSQMYLHREAQWASQGRSSLNAYGFHLLIPYP